MKQFFPAAALFLVLMTLPVFVSAQMTVSISQTNITCFGGCNGSATATATGGVPPYNCVWMPGNITGPTCTNMCPGTYTATVTDQMATTVTATVVITQPSQLIVTPSSVAATSCSSCNGSVSASVSGGVAPYTYCWNTCGCNTSSCPGECPGTYTCLLTDANGCTATGVTTVGSPASPTVTITSTVTSTCSGNGVTLSASGAMTYVWMPGSLSGSPIIVTPATTTTYTVTGTAPNGCTSTATVTINVTPASVGGTVSGAANVCPGNNSGTLTLSGYTGSVIRWEFSTDGGVTWVNIANVSTTQTYSNITGTRIYRAWVQNAGCPAAYSTNATVNVQTLPAISLSEIPATCNGSNGSATVTVNSGSPPYSFNWLPCCGTTQVNSGLSIGTYNVMVTDGFGCTVTGTITVTDSCNYVWPGDANDDAVADNVDILDIGIANGATGTTRANASLTWIGQPSVPWGQTLMSGTDYKWVDCDGNGSINPIDTQAVTLNFGMTHTNRYAAPTFTQSAPTVGIAFDQDSIAAGSTGTLTLSLGDAADQATNVYGIAFRLNYDATQLSTSSFGMTSGANWFGTPGNDLMRVVLHPSPTNGYVDVAITRLDHQDVSGYGTIGQIYFTTTTALAGSGTALVVPMNITNVVLVDGTGAQQPVNVANDSIVVADSSIILNVANNSTQNFSVYPNPAQNQFTVTLGEQYVSQNTTVELRDVQGRLIATQYSNGNSSVEFSTANLAAGTYLISAVCETCPTTTTRLIITR